MKLTLNEITIQKLKWNGTTKIYWDATVPSFGIRVGKKRKTFIARLSGSRSDVALGHYPQMALKEARALARVAKVETAPKTPLRGILSPTEAFLRDAGKRLKPETVSQYAQYLKALEIDLEKLSRAEINQKLSKYDGKPHAQNYAYAALRAFLNWCLAHELIDKHPLIRGKLPNKVRSRDRVLSDEEIARIYRCTDDNTYGRIIRLLILTGQRRIEVRNLKPEDVSEDLLTFHTKGDRINILPITPLMRENLVLPFKFNNWAQAKDKLFTECRVEFRHHDLRRTMATRMAELGVDVITIERVLGHTLGGVAGVYNRYQYQKEKREALLIWEAHIKKIITA